MGQPAQLPVITFIAPAIGVPAGPDVQVGVVPFRGNGRTLIRGEPAGPCKTTSVEMGRILAPHPTLSDAISEAARAVHGEAIHR